MALADMREYLSILEANGELACVDAELDPAWEVGLLARTLMDRQAEAALLRNVAGASMPVVMNLFSNRRRCALALGVEESDLLPHFLAALEGPVEPVLVDDAPCQEVVHTEGDLLAQIPKIHWNPGDGGPYITFGLTISRDPETQHKNMGIYRIQIFDENRIGLNAHPPSHCGVAHARAAMRGESLPVAIVIGGDPSLYLASQAPGSYPHNEVALAGALRGAPVPVVKCKTVDLEVPAGAEMVIEGQYLPEEVAHEGPFGEFTGYYSGASMRGVVQITAVTMRRDAYFIATYEGKPPTNTHIIHSLAREPVWYAMLKRDACPTIKDINVTYGGSSCLHVIVSMKPLSHGHARNVGLELIRIPNIKHAVIVDTDIDVRDMNAVEWAIATRVQADRDVIIIPGLGGMHLDPSQPDFPHGVSGKMIIDATAPLKGLEGLITFDADKVNEVDRRWSEYGFRR